MHMQIYTFVHMLREWSMELQLLSLIGHESVAIMSESGFQFSYIPQKASYNDCPCIDKLFAQRRMMNVCTCNNGYWYILYNKSFPIIIVKTNPFIFKTNPLIHIHIVKTNPLIHIHTVNVLSSTCILMVKHPEIKTVYSGCIKQAIWRMRRRD